MDKASKLYEFIAARPNLFEDGHSVHTPKALVEEILDKVQLDGSILAMFNIEFVISLVYNYNINPENITFYSDSENKTILSNKLGVKYITSLETDMKFDVVLANPPYNDKDILLYPIFFKKCIEIAETLVMIMPTDLNSQQVRLKKHNHLVKTHMISMSDNVTDHFKVGIPDIRYVSASKNHKNNLGIYVDPLTTYVEILTNHKRLKPRRGMGEFSRKSNHDPNGIPCITSVYRGNEIQWTNINSKIVNKSKSIMDSTAPWLVLAQEHPSNGLFNVTVIKNNGVKWGSGLFAFDCSSEDDAKKLEAWLVSSTIQTEVKKLLSIKNTHSISGPMIKKLPHYE